MNIKAAAPMLALVGLSVWLGGAHIAYSQEEDEKRCIVEEALYDSHERVVLADLKNVEGTVVARKTFLYADEAPTKLKSLSLQPPTVGGKDSMSDIHTIQFGLLGQAEDAKLLCLDNNGDLIRREDLPVLVNPFAADQEGVTSPTHIGPVLYKTTTKICGCSNCAEMSGIADCQYVWGWIPEKTETDSMGRPVVVTSVGKYVIDEVEISDRRPPGCKNPKTFEEDRRASCRPALDGHQYVVLWLEPTSESQWQKLQRGNPPTFPMERTMAMVVAPDHLGFKSGMGFDSPPRDQRPDPPVGRRVYVAFMAGGSGTDYTLFSKGNPPIKLEVR